MKICWKDGKRQFTNMKLINIIRIYRVCSNQPISLLVQPLHPLLSALSAPTTLAAHAPHWLLIQHILLSSLVHCDILGDPHLVTIVLKWVSLVRLLY